MQYKLAIFDMDGTLLDSMGAWRLTVKEYLRDNGYPDLPALADSRYRPTPSSREIALRELTLPLSAEQLRAECLRRTMAHYDSDVTLKPGALAFLDAMREAGVVCGLLTATPLAMARGVLERTGIAPRMRFVLCDGDLPAAKDNPECFRWVARQNGVQTADCLVFDDALYAIRSARQAGCTVVAMEEESSLWQRDEIRKTASFYARSFCELLGEK